MKDSNDARRALETAYAQPLDAARAHHEDGGKVVGFVGNTVPTELILATGMFPVLIAPDPPRSTPAADRLIEHTEPWSMRVLADQALDGRLGFVDLLVIYRSEEWLYYNLKEAVRLGDGAAVPPLHLFDLIQNHKDSVTGYNRVQVRDLLDRLNRVGEPATQERLEEAVSLVNRRRNVIRRLDALRPETGLSGVEAMTFVGAGWFLHPSDYCVHMEAVLEDSAPPDTGGAPKLLVITSEPLYHLELHRSIEAAGGRVIAEDSWWGSRAAGADVAANADVIATLADSYAWDTQGEDVLPLEVRHAWVRERLAQGNVDGVVFYIPPSDKRFGWGYPELHSIVRQAGVPSVLLRGDVLDERGRREITEQVQSLLREAGEQQGLVTSGRSA